MRTALALIAGLLLVGCDPVPGADRDEVAGPPAAGRETIQPASPAASGAGQVSLGDRLSCRETDLFAQPVAVQAARLTHGAALTCGVQVEGGPFAACTGDGRLRLFGLPVLAVWVLAEGVEQGLQIHFRSDAANVATAAGRALGVPLRRRFGEPGYSYNGLGVDALHYYVRPRKHSEATFGCTLPAPAGEAALPPLPRPDGWALLSGSVSYPGEHDPGEPDPGEYVPAMRVCAVDIDDRGRGHCVLTPEGDPYYRLPVPPGHWWLLAWPQGTGNATEPGRHSAASGCIAEQRTRCDDHGPRAIEIGANEHRGGLPINDWFADPRTDPAPPAPL